jgi:transcriptional regulator with XRE-family HTH domain
MKSKVFYTMKTKGKANPIDEYVGKRLRQKRDLSGLSQERLAEHVGVTFQQIQKYENGQNRISASRLYEFSQFIKVPISFFFDNLDSASNQNETMATGLSDGATQESLSGYANPMETKEARELIRHYFYLKDPKLRKNLLKFVKTMAENLKAQENS